MPENLGRGYLFSKVQKLTLGKELKMKLMKIKTKAKKAWHQPYSQAEKL